MTDNNQQLTGNDLLMYLMSRFNMTKPEALNSMRRAGHDTSNLSSKPRPLRALLPRGYWPRNP